MCKSKYIIFHVPQRKINFPSLEIEDIAITYIGQFSFLGITLDTHVNWNADTNNISNKISSVIGIINRINIISKYNPYTEPLFKLVSKFKVEDILKKQQFKFLNSLINNNVTFYFRSMLLGFVA